jgi:hypothetical protein
MNGVNFTKCRVDGDAGVEANGADLDDCAQYRTGTSNFT